MMLAGIFCLIQVVVCVRMERGHLLLASGQAPTRKAFYIGVLSAPQNVERRRHWRENCLPTLQQGGLDFTFKFIIGRPSNSTSLDTHTQGMVATEDERNKTKALLDEYEEHKDITFTTGREYYRDLPDKTLHVLERAYMRRARFVVKCDDDVCPHADPLSQLATSDTYDNDTRMLYGGSYLWNGTEYENQRGANGETAQYFSGPAYVLSRNLIKAIIIEFNAHTYMWPYYGSSSEDVDMGMWVAHVRDNKPDAVIDTFDNFTHTGGN